MLEVSKLMENFCVNECVTCTHDFVMRSEYLKEIPVKGASYFIRKILVPYHRGTGTFLLLKEIINPEYSSVEDDFHNEVGFNSKFFEASAKKTSIAVFQNILKKFNNDSHQENQS